MFADDVENAGVLISPPNTTAADADDVDGPGGGVGNKDGTVPSSSGKSEAIRNDSKSHLKLIYDTCYPPPLDSGGGGSVGNLAGETVLIVPPNRMVVASQRSKSTTDDGDGGGDVFSLPSPYPPSYPRFTRRALGKAGGKSIKISVVGVRGAKGTVRGAEREWKILKGEIGR